MILKPIYEALWQELNYLYKQDKPQFMLNPIRRILETYIKFNNLKPAQFYEPNPEAKKMFDVNSHAIDDLEADLNGKNCRDVEKMLSMLFIDNKAEEHFKAHWKSSAQ